MKTEEQKNKAASKRVGESLLAHKASESRFNAVKRTKKTFLPRVSSIGNHRFPIMSKTNLREWENEFSHCCKLVLLSRIVSHATCLLMAENYKNSIAACTDGLC